MENKKEKKKQNRLCPYCFEHTLKHTPHEEYKLSIDDNLTVIKCLNCKTETIIDKNDMPIVMKSENKAYKFDLNCMDFVHVKGMDGRDIETIYLILKEGNK